MSTCTADDWSMDLVKYGRPFDEKKTFTFDDLTIVNEIITGKVYDADRNFVSDLRGTCSAFGSGEYMARLNFFFRAKANDASDIEICLLGWAFRPPGSDRKPVFRGGYVVLAVSSGESLLQVNFDVGETGTGTGMQAQGLGPNRT
jgi:hypothetical protein